MSTNTHTFILHRHNTNSKNLKDWDREDTVVKASKEEEEKKKPHIFKFLKIIKRNKFLFLLLK